MESNDEGNKSEAVSSDRELFSDLSLCINDPVLSAVECSVSLTSLQHSLNLYVWVGTPSTPQTFAQESPPSSKEAAPSAAQ